MEERVQSKNYSLFAESLVNRYVGTISGKILDDVFVDRNPSEKILIGKLASNRVTQNFVNGYTENKQNQFTSIPSINVSFKVKKNVEGIIYFKPRGYLFYTITPDYQKTVDYILDEFREEIRSNKKIASDGRGCCGLQIISSGIVDGLRQYGLHPRKSLDCWFPDNIPLDLYPHFVRGLFDGDGSASYYARRGRRSHTKAIRFCSGTRQFLEDLIELLYYECGSYRVSIYQEKEHLWSIRYASNDSMLKIINYMYDDAHVYLYRKKEICDLICDEIYNYGNTEITM